MSDVPCTEERLDIVEELEARGDALSLRAARYIRIKRTSLRLVEETHSRLCSRLLKQEAEHVH